MLKNMGIVLLLLLFTGCTSLKPIAQGAESNSVMGNGLMAKEYTPAEREKLDSNYGLWGAVAKGLAVLAGLTPATGVATGVAALIGASSAGVAFYADNRGQAYTTNCLK